MERRSEIRLPVSGSIELSFEDPTLVTIQATLLETSTRGFRAAHDSNMLAPGLEVRFGHAGSQGRARVIWTHVLEGQRVSGFLLI
jgi:hypothetical protein